MQIPYGYKLLIQRFLNKEIPVQEFVGTYLERFQNEKAVLGQSLFLVLDKLFAEIDFYTEDNELIKKSPRWNINEDQLRQYAQEALVKIENFEKRRDE